VEDEMAKVPDAELIKLVSAAFDRTVAEKAIDVGNVSLSIATALVRVVQEAGMIVIRDQRDRAVDGADPFGIRLLRHPVPA
jgi:hypothetical protein